MKLTLLSIAVCLLIFSVGKTQKSQIPQGVKDIVSSMEAIDIVQSEFIGYAGAESKNYQNFLALKKNANTDELIELTYYHNHVVACYAAMALADKSYPGIASVFSSFLSKNKKVKTLNGCIGGEDDMASVLYHEYWNKIEDNTRATDKTLLAFDSVILYSNNHDWLIIYRALNNRLYNEPYKSRIATLAFDEGVMDAVYYLCNWHKAEYADRLKTALLWHLKHTDFSETGTTDYYETTQQLFSFKSPDINKQVIDKIKNDRHWEMEKGKFKNLLEENDIYDIDSE